MVFKIIMLLLGPVRVAHRWKWIAAVGATMIFVGLTMVIDATDTKSQFILGSLGWIALGLAAIDVAAIFAAPTGPDTLMRAGKAGCFVLFGLASIISPMRIEREAPLFIGIAFTLLGLFKVVWPLLGRYPNWWWGVGAGVGYLTLGVLCFHQWTNKVYWVIPMLFGAGLILYGVSALTTAWGLRMCQRAALLGGPPAGAIEFFIRHFVGYRYLPVFKRLPPHSEVVEQLREANPPDASKPAEIRVHIWIPNLTLDHTAINLPVVGTYVFAPDTHGGMSVGHSALEMPGGEVYVSHYSLRDYDLTVQGIEEPDPERDNILLRAKSQDMAGAFFDNHEHEVKCWRPPSITLKLPRFDAGYLRHFWAYYRQDSTYNIALRNCSVSAIMALDVALLGVLRGPRMVPRFIQLLCHPQIWRAAFIRKRAEEMVWSPGFVRDYADAIQRVIADFPA